MVNRRWILESWMLCANLLWTPPTIGPTRKLVASSGLDIPSACYSVRLSLEHIALISPYSLVGFKSIRDWAWSALDQQSLWQAFEHACVVEVGCMFYFRSTNNAGAGSAHSIQVWLCVIPKVRINSATTYWGMGLSIYVVLHLCLRDADP